MTYKKQLGAIWLHQVKHQIAQRRVWDKKERELVRLADLRRQMGGVA